MLSAELARFLVHSVELESEARERYLELAESMAAHHNDPVAEFFQRMAGEASLHLEEVEQLTGSDSLPQLAAWEFDWPDAEAPESTAYEALHYRMSLQQAVRLALASERRAERYYRRVADSSSEPETVQVARQFAEEEAQHAAQLEKILQELGPEPDHLRLEDDAPHMPE